MLRALGGFRKCRALNQEFEDFLEDYGRKAI